MTGYFKMAADDGWSSGWGGAGGGGGGWDSAPAPAAAASTVPDESEELVAAREREAQCRAEVARLEAAWDIAIATSGRARITLANASSDSERIAGQELVRECIKAEKVAEQAASSAQASLLEAVNAVAAAQSKGMASSGWGPLAPISRGSSAAAASPQPAASLSEGRSGGSNPAHSPRAAEPTGWGAWGSEASAHAEDADVAPAWTSAAPSTVILPPGVAMDMPVVDAVSGAGGTDLPRDEGAAVPVVDDADDDDDDDPAPGAPAPVPAAVAPLPDIEPVAPVSLRRCMSAATDAAAAPSAGGELGMPAPLTGLHRALSAGGDGAEGGSCTEAEEHRADHAIADIIEAAVMRAMMSGPGGADLAGMMGSGGSAATTARDGRPLPRRTDGKFVDPDFPPDDTSVGGDAPDRARRMFGAPPGASGPRVAWVPSSRVGLPPGRPAGGGMGGWVLVRSTPSARDLRQGASESRRSSFAGRCV